MLLRILIGSFLALTSIQSSIADIRVDDAKKKAIETIQGRIANYRKSSAQATAEIDEKLKMYKAGQIDPKAPGVMHAKPPKLMRFPSQAVKDKEIAKLDEQLTAARSRAKETIADPLTKFAGMLKYEVGEFGSIEAGGTVNVVQIIDAQSVVIKVFKTDSVTRKSTPITFLVSGVDTSKMADRAGTKFEGVFFITGNKKVGSTTLFEAIPIPFTPAEIEKLAKPN
jgi:hypothetical protein